MFFFHTGFKSILVSFNRINHTQSLLPGFFFGNLNDSLVNCINSFNHWWVIELEERVKPVWVQIGLVINMDGNKTISK